MDIKTFYPSMNPRKAEVCKFVRSRAIGVARMWDRLATPMNRAGIEVKNVDLDKLSMYVGKEFEI